ncbi:MAG: CoA-acylating methylmalonate-semialdehyde dehydrogenase [Oligoflexales bacterium]|nr:CoA-acylating methylmalonate-semialdehyde dehydrogenase [Oligoflexales bacterium]
MLVKNYVGSRWVESLSKESNEVLNPATGEVIARTPKGTVEDVQAAVKIANEAFKSWRKVPATERIQYLFRIKALIEQNDQELIKIITIENGKTVVEAKGSLHRAIQMIETAAGIPNLMMGDYFSDIAPGIDSQMVRRPLGVFAAITPFNFPVMIPFWFWPFAIACGNTFVLKVSERVPLSAVKVFELIDKLNLPKGVINLVHGGKEVAQELCRHPLVKGISFVGSTAVAKEIYNVGCSHGKRVQALGGAKNIMVFTSDALDSAFCVKNVQTAVESVTGCAGERCLAGSLLLSVGEASYGLLQKEVLRAAQQIQVGNGLDETVDMGPLISQAAKDRVLALIDKALAQGAKLLLDGRKIAKESGFFLGPTVLGEVTASMEIAQVEVFGPVILLGKTPSLDQAIAWINSSSYANTCTLFTNSGAHARKFSHEVEPGMVGINIGVPAPMSFFSFGGSKSSFFGDVKVHGKDCIQFFTETQTTLSRWAGESGVWSK